jgi:hypothetical protein
VSPPRRAAAPGLDSEGRRQRRFGSTAEANDSRSQVYPTDALARRRSKREADKLVRLLREQLGGLESGEIPFAVAACTIDVLGSLLADLALRGERVA